MLDQERLPRLVAQHAQTARLMGVDFVPMFRSGTGADDEAGGGVSGVSAAADADVAPDGAEAEPLTPVVKVAAGRTESGMTGSGQTAGIPGSLLPVERSAAPKATAGGSATSGSTAAGAGGSVMAPQVARESAPRDRERAAKRLAEIRAQYEKDAPHQHFVTSFTNIVFGEGDPCARLMFVGEAPGEEEDKTGRPFVGRAGQLLNKMIGAMGLKREDVYIANVLKTRPPNNATPTQEEARLCSPYLFQQIEAIGPDAIVTLGLPASRLLLDTVESMSRLRGMWHVFRTGDGREVPVMPTYHPAFLLRSYTPENRAKVWSDLRMVITRLGLPMPAEKPSAT